MSLRSPEVSRGILGYLEVSKMSLGNLEVFEMFFRIS